jgi:hypothetical protein
MPDYKLNHLSSLPHESYHPLAPGIRCNLAQTATEVKGKSETKLHHVAGVMDHSMRVRGEKGPNFSQSFLRSENFWLQNRILMAETGPAPMPWFSRQIPNATPSRRL